MREAADDVGPSPAVVLLHGQPGRALHWNRVVDDLPSWLTVVAEDRPGYGTNAAPATGLYGNARAVLRRLDDLGVERAVIAGHSWAGGVALALAERHADRVAGIALLSAIGPGAVTWLDRALALPFLGDFASWAAFQVAGPIVRRRLLEMLGNDPAVRADLTAGGGRAEWRTFLVEQQTMVRELPALVDGLAEISAPAVVVTGADDRVVRPAVAEALAEAIPSAELRVLPGEGHALPLTAPAEVAAAIISVASWGAPPPNCPPNS